MVSKLGMSDKIGYLSLMENNYSRGHSESTLAIVDSEIQEIIKEATEKALTIIREKE